MLNTSVGTICNGLEIGNSNKRQETLIIKAYTVVTQRPVPSSVRESAILPAALKASRAGSAKSFA